MPLPFRNIDGNRFSTRNKIHHFDYLISILVI